MRPLLKRLRWIAGRGGGFAQWLAGAGDLQRHSGDRAGIA